MRACYFKTMMYGETNWVGLVFGNDMKEIMWAIDEFVDPYQVLVRPVEHSGGVIFKQKMTGDELETVGFEMSETFADIDEKDGWQVPPWAKD